MLTPSLNGEQILPKTKLTIVRITELYRNALPTKN